MTPMRRAACGGCRLFLNGVDVVARVSGALWVPGERTLALGDLHFEKGSAFGARCGQLLPPYDTLATLDRLEAEIQALEPSCLILMGDSFHDAGAEDRLAPEAVARITALGAGRALVWLAGNHDPAPPLGLPGDVAESWIVDALTLVHEPGPAPAFGEVAGHLHPVATISGYGARVRRRCFLTDGARLILPAFGAYAGGLNVAHPAFAGLFSGPPTALILGDGRIHATPVARLKPGR